MNRTYSFLTLLIVVALSVVFGMVLGGKLNTPKVVFAAALLGSLEAPEQARKVLERADHLPAVRAGGWSSVAQGRRNSGRQAPGHDEEPGVPDHAVVGTHGQPFDVPGALHGLRGLGLGEGLHLSRRFDHARHLGRGGHVAAQQAARDERLPDRRPEGLKALGRHV